LIDGVAVGLFVLVGRGEGLRRVGAEVGATVGDNVGFNVGGAVVGAGVSTKFVGE
jgi:hypothetical protein